jgi:hypothetical protein
MLLFFAAAPLVALYLTVKFIKWAWYSGSNKKSQLPSWYGESSSDHWII